MTFQVAQLHLPVEMASDKLALALILVAEMSRQRIPGSVTIHLSDTGKVAKVDEHRVHR